MIEKESLFANLGLQSKKNLDVKLIVTFEGIGDMTLKKTSCGNTLLQFACLKRPSLEEWDHLYNVFGDGEHSISHTDGLSIHVACTSSGGLCFNIIAASAEEQTKDVLPLLEDVVNFCKNGVTK